MKKILTAHKIAKIKGAKISLWTNSPKLRAAKIKGFTVHKNNLVGVNCLSDGISLFNCKCLGRYCAVT